VLTLHDGTTLPVDEWRRQKNEGYISAIGEYVPPEFWEVLDHLEAEVEARQQAEAMLKCIEDQAASYMTRTQEAEAQVAVLVEAIRSNEHLPDCACREGPLPCDCIHDRLDTILAALPARARALLEIVAAFRTAVPGLPTWMTKDCGPGYFPTSYGTLTHEGDLKVIEAVTAGIAALAAYDGGEDERTYAVESSHPAPRRR